ncbi:MAG: hypothetical protein ABI779_27370 [Acidobacteriota bacterium]
MSVSETGAPRRFMWPADYYTGPSPRAVLPRGVTYGCGAASLVVLVVVFAGGAFLASGGMAQFMDFALGMTMGDVRGIYAKDVTAAEKQELEDAIEALRSDLRDGKAPVTKLQPVLEALRLTMADGKMSPAEVKQVAAAARKAK